MPAIVEIKLDIPSGKLNFDNSWFNIGKIEHAIGDFLFIRGETAPSILDFLPDIAWNAFDFWNIILQSKRIMEQSREIGMVNSYELVNP